MWCQKEVGNVRKLQTNRWFPWHEQPHLCRQSKYAWMSPQHARDTHGIPSPGQHRSPLAACEATPLLSQQLARLLAHLPHQRPSHGRGIPHSHGLALR